jgi:hypothetical protein
MLQGLTPSKITLHVVQFIACQRKKGHLLRDGVVRVDEILPEKLPGAKKGQLWNICVLMEKNIIQMELKRKQEMSRFLT